KDAGSSWDFGMDRPFLAKAEHDILTLAGVNIATGMGGEWIYAGTELGLTRVPDCFCRWQGVEEADPMAGLVNGKVAVTEQSLPEGQALLSLAVAPSVPATLFAGLQTGVWNSTDVGLNWAQVSDHPAPHLAVNPTEPNHVIAAADGAILSSRDGGITWSAPAAA
ncbi:MAG: exo-alpha-sialidase, partial [Paracoccaceae bacterium]